jgi:TRAP-type C4-dicarboxylate transport system permease small subunit
VVIAFAIAQTQYFRGHIEVEFIVQYLPKNIQRVISIFVHICLLVLWAVIAWRSVDFGMVLQSTGEVSMTERIPFYPFVYAIAFCCIPMFLVVLIQLIKKLSEASK